MYQKFISKIIYLNQFYSLSFTNRAIHEGRPHIRGEGVRQKWTNVDRSRGGGVVSQMWTSTWKKNYSYHICEIYSDKWNLFFFQIMILEHFHFCLANMPVWHIYFVVNPSFGMQLSKLSNRNTRVHVCPNVDRPEQVEVGSQKFPNLCGQALWITPVEKIDMRSFLNRINKKGDLSSGSK